MFVSVGCVFVSVGCVRVVYGGEGGVGVHLFGCRCVLCCVCCVVLCCVVCASPWTTSAPTTASRGPAPTCPSMRGVYVLRALSVYSLPSPAFLTSEDYLKRDDDDHGVN